ncbi:hypothetical protein ACHAWO_007388 [Cyclotella atomus]|uniref:Uncharacterized protein n=1 Tax=Cyclotella atomus TaxID=382360 RepID=A0ABD3PL63_9STRA
MAMAPILCVAIFHLPVRIRFLPITKITRKEHTIDIPRITPLHSFANFSDSVSASFSNSSIDIDTYSSCWISKSISSSSKVYSSSCSSYPNSSSIGATDNTPLRCKVMYSTTTFATLSSKLVMISG